MVLNNLRLLVCIDYRYQYWQGSILGLDNKSVAGQKYGNNYAHFLFLQNKWPWKLCRNVNRSFRYHCYWFQRCQRKVWRTNGMISCTFWICNSCSFWKIIYSTTFSPVISWTWISAWDINSELKYNLRQKYVIKIWHCSNWNHNWATLYNFLKWSEREIEMKIHLGLTVTWIWE